MSVPPRATLIICMPRQTPKIGLPAWENGVKQRQLCPVPLDIGRIGAPVLLTVQDALQIAAAAENQPVTGQIGDRAIAGQRYAACLTDRIFVADGCILRAGELDFHRR